MTNRFGDVDVTRFAPRAEACQRAKTTSLVQINRFGWLVTREAAAACVPRGTCRVFRLDRDAGLIRAAACRMG